MTRSEFIVRANRWRYAQVWVSLKMLAAIVLLCYALWWCARHNQITGNLFWGLLVGGLIVIVIWSAHGYKRAARNLGLICPSCNGMLVSVASSGRGPYVEQDTYQVTAVTGLCGRCGAKVLQD